MKYEYKPKFFPFSAGIPWKTDRGKYIIPEIDSETWNQVLDGKNIIITVFGGLFESFFSLSAAEALVSFGFSHKLFWLGNKEFLPLVRAQNLCKPSFVEITTKILKDYPTPIFFDKDNNAYFNLLNNYIIRTSYWGKYPEPVESPVMEQIFRNVMVPWKDNIPKLRNLGTEFYDELCNIGRINNRSKIILIVLDKTKEDLLGWNLHNIKEFAQLVTNKGLKVVVFAHDIYRFYGSKILVYEYNLRHIFQVLNSSWLLLSNDINWLLVGLMQSNTHIISRYMEGPFDLIKNAEVINATNDIFISMDKVSPIDAFTIIEGLL